MAEDQPRTPITSYAKGIQARQEERRAEKARNPIFPNLGQAAVTHSPGDERTLEQIGEQQRADAALPPEEQPRRAELSPETIKGLQALKAAEEQKRQQLDKEKVPTATEPEAVPEPEDDSEDALFAKALRGAQQDIIQNERERAAVAKRVGEIDLSAGLIHGEFTQLVPIIPGKLDVMFRCMTMGENNELRMYLHDQVHEDPRRGPLAETLLAFYQTVASVVSINKTVYHKHMVSDGPMGRLTFNKTVFEEKLHAFMAFPLPLVASLGAHGGWFEQRVRELFATSDPLKNG